MNKTLKKYYPKDKTFCSYSDECKIICPRRLSDYEWRLLNCEVSFANFKGTDECRLRGENGV